MRTSHTNLPTPRRDAGFSIIEASVAVGVLALASLGTASMLVTSGSLEAAVKTERAAMKSTVDLMEEIDSRPFDEIFAYFNDDPNDDPEGAGTAPGGTVYFDVQSDGSRRRITNPGDAAATLLTVEVEFPTDGTGQLAENGEVLFDGMPTDFDGDNTVEAADPDATVGILPMQVKLTFVSNGKQKTIAFQRVLGPKASDQKTKSDKVKANAVANVASRDTEAAVIGDKVRATRGTLSSVAVSIAARVYVNAALVKIDAAALLLSQAGADLSLAKVDLNSAVALLNTGNIAVGLPATITDVVIPTLTSYVGDIDALPAL